MLRYGAYALAREHAALCAHCGHLSACTDGLLLLRTRCSLGNPHLSLQECHTLANLCESSVAPLDPRVSMVATLGRTVLEQATAAGYTATMEKFGVQFITDTCWCMLTEP